MNTDKSDKAQSATFEIIASEKDNPERKEFEIGNWATKSFRKTKA